MNPVDTQPFELMPHSLPVLSSSVGFGFQRESDVLKFRFLIQDPKAEIKWRPDSPSKLTRGNELYHSTCFELFLADSTGAYQEWNFAAPNLWDYQSFSSYRCLDGRDPSGEPTMLVERISNGTLLSGTIPCTGKLMRMGVCAVLETSDDRYYYALKHAYGKPDFHKSDCFILTI